MAPGYNSAVGRITTILFDFFGTLVDYEHRAAGDGFRGSHEWFVDAGGMLEYETYLEALAKVSDAFEAEAGRTHIEYRLEDFVDGFFSAHGLQCGDRAGFIDAYIGEWNAGVRYSEPIHAAVHELSGRFRLGVVTNTHLEWLVPGHLERMGLGHRFQHVVTSCGHGKRKPHPEIFGAALEKFGVRADEALFVGDSLEADFHGASGAGMRALLVDPLGLSGLPLEARLRSVAELPQWLETHAG